MSITIIILVFTKEWFPIVLYFHPFPLYYLINYVYISTHEYQIYFIKCNVVSLILVLFFGIFWFLYRSFLLYPYMLYCFLYSHSAFIAWFGYSHFDLWLPLLNFRTLTEFLLNMFLVHYYESKQLSELWSFMTRYWCWPWVHTMNAFDVQCYWCLSGAHIMSGNSPLNYTLQALIYLPFLS